MAIVRKAELEGNSARWKGTMCGLDEKKIQQRVGSI